MFRLVVNLSVHLQNWIDHEVWEVAWFNLTGKGYFAFKWPSVLFITKTSNFILTFKTFYWNVLCIVTVQSKNVLIKVKVRFFTLKHIKGMMARIRKNKQGLIGTPLDLPLSDRDMCYLGLQLAMSITLFNDLTGSTRSKSKTCSNTRVDEY